MLSIILPTLYKITEAFKQVNVAGVATLMFGKAPFWVTVTTVLFVQPFSGLVTVNE